MKVSQLIHAMFRDDEIVIDDFDAPTIDKMTLYKGATRGIKKDDPINKMHVLSLCAVNDSIRVLVRKQRADK